MSDDPILSALARLEAGQASMQADQASLRTGFQALHTGFQTLRTDFHTLRTDMLAELGQTRGAIMGRMAELQASVTAIRDDIAVNMGRVDAVRQANDNTRADLVQMREQMSVMWKQIKTLEARVRGITGDP
jgi:chromosome segregation ATPase